MEALSVLEQIRTMYSVAALVDFSELGRRGGGGGGTLCTQLPGLLSICEKFLREEVK